ncbi:MAG TPA: dihydrofolate reductase [Candidatus Dormibacteraeota bacterium]|nr:dihydrofolate reductase [Candidatus Dormibacteraeota bacterium]
MIRLIAAMDLKRGLAKHGYMPWNIPEDEAYFTDQTKTYGGKVLTGGKTFRDTYKHGPLAGRTNYVLTRNTQLIEGVQLVHDLSAWLPAMGETDIWVAGGADVYEQVIDANKADELYITHIDADFGCDKFFPEYQTKFRLKNQSKPHFQNGFNFTYAVYTRS